MIPDLDLGLEGPRRSRRVVVAMSGGVDSSVAAVLIHKAIGDRLTCIFVDNGLLRKGEVERVERIFRGSFHIDLDVVDAADRFLDKLSDVEDPERKRKIIGAEFIAVFEEEARRVGGAEFLAQGTLYPDVIESLSFKGPSAVIKSHHNVGGLPEEMGLQLIEPFRELFKDEVREVGRELGIPEEIGKGSGARFKVHVGHPNDRHGVPTIGPHRSRRGTPDPGGRFPGA